MACSPCWSDVGARLVTNAAPLPTKDLHEALANEVRPLYNIERVWVSHCRASVWREAILGATWVMGTRPGWHRDDWQLTAMAAIGMCKCYGMVARMTLTTPVPSIN